MSSRANRIGVEKRLARRLGIRQGEERPVAWTVGFFTVSVAGISVGANAADTLFFLRFGVEFLPTMILFSGPVVMLGTTVFAAGLGRVGARKWLPIVFASCTLALGVERILIAGDAHGIYPAVWLTGQAILVVAFTSMWVMAGEVCTTRQAKRLYPIFASAGIAGGVIGNVMTGPLARLVGTENLLVAQAILFAVGAAMAMAIGRRFFQDTPAARGSVASDLGSGLALTLRSRMLRLVALAGLALNALFFLVVFPFSEVVTAAFDTEEDVAAYLGGFAALATAATFLVSLIVANRLLARFGVVMTLAVVPIAYVVGFAVWVGWLNLTTATLVRGLQWVAVNALGATAWSSLFNVLSRQRRGQVMAFMTAGPAQLGTVLSGAILLAGAAMSQQVRTVVGLFLGVVTLLVIWRMRPAYGLALVDAVKAGMIEVFTAPTTGVRTASLDADTLDAIAVSLEDKRPEARKMGVSMLARLDPDRARELVSRALGDSEPLVRLAAIEAMRQWPAPDLTQISTILRDPDATIRQRALEMIQDTGVVAPPELEEALEDEQPAVRALAAALVGGPRADRVIAALVDSDDPDEVAAGLRAVRIRPEGHELDLTRFIDHHDRFVREAVGPAMVAAGGEMDQVRRLLDDASVPTRHAAAAALAKNGEGADVLLDVLETGSVRATDAALRALRDAGIADDRLASWASREITRASHLRSNRSVLERDESSSGAGDYLVEVLRARERRLETWAILALTRRDTEEAMTTVTRGMWYDDLETRAQALEALDSLAERTMARRLSSLIESDPGAAAGDRRSTLRVLATDFDHWVRALAVRSLADETRTDLERLAGAAANDPSPLVREGLARWELPTMQESRTLDTIECVISLSRVSMFAEIDPEDLERLAAVTTERHFQPDELIYREGEEGDEMILIVGGQVVARRLRDGEIVNIRTFGPGEYVGELALLRGQPRIADVMAGPEGARALVLGSAEFQAILQERPEVAMAMLGTLAERLATS